VRDEVETTLRWKNSDEDPDAYLAALDLQAFEGRHPRDLYAGQRLLVATAAMAATGAPLLLLDEPTRGLDPHSKDRLSRFIEMCAAEGKGVIFATHDVELVAGLAGRVVMLAGGEVISEGTPAEVIGDSAVFAPQMARVFGPEWMTTTQVLAAVGVP
jgi:energy-coupling factor transport system ATP-binding protein